MSNTDSKNDKEIVLTIGIPTYNGESSLRDVIDKIIADVNKYRLTNIELLVSNNCSLDNTDQLMTKYIEMYPQLISYYINDKNVGFDRNVDLVVRRSKGRFVWILSDNDTILSEGILKVLKCIKNNPEAALIFVDYSLNEKMKCNIDKMCFNGDDFFKFSIFKSGMISSNVVNRKNWLNENISIYFDSGWIHLGYTIEVANKNVTYILADELVRCSDKPQSWGADGTFVLVGLRLGNLFKRMYPLSYNKTTIKRALNIARGVRKFGIPISVPWGKALGLRVDFEIIKEMCFVFGRLWSFWFFEFIFLLIPSSFFVLLRNLKKHFKV